ncbi:MAG: energy-coupling factor transporter transmembrane protein EcfT [Clostridiales bacterium]|jgi:energy-coupling factor transport system permease protein|nr:energy-coupling factor transporter transmembrane protein EcfT [Clostridiales bacterium]
MRKTKESKGNKGDLDFAEKRTANALYKKRAGVTESFHPVILLVYFVGMAAVTMVTLHPVLLGVSFIGAVFCTGMLTGMRKLLKSLAYSIPMLAVIAVINPMFVHKGETILFFYNNNPVTLEAILYGAAAALMIVAVFYWFKCYSIVMTSDKVIYLFGRILPRLSLVLSMTLGFVPKLKKQYKKISAAQKSMGMYASNSVTDRVLSRFRVLSALVGWALESSVETADSMSAKGYGLRGRSSYATYSWTRRDLFILVFVLLALGVLTAGMSLGAGVGFYPAFKGISAGLWDIVAYAGIAVLGLFAGLMELWENIKWRLFVSKV